MPPGNQKRQAAPEYKVATAFYAPAAVMCADKTAFIAGQGAQVMP
jgi:hypothetical protein